MEKGWEKYTIGRISKNGNYKEDCIPFKNIFHVTHVDAFFNMLKDGYLSPRLVNDESKLSEKRILVLWLSPFIWASGYRYGTIKLNLDWQKLINNKNFYWVESIGYKIEAARILITDEDRENEFEKYDPKIGNGPWWYDETNNIHYHNGKFCLEIMIEGRIEIEEILSFEIVEHNNQMCSMNRYQPSKCPELLRPKYVTSCIVLAEILKKCIICNDYYFLKLSINISENGSIFNDALEYIYFKFKNYKNYNGNIMGRDIVAQPLFICILDGIIQKNNDLLNSLLELFKSFDEILELFKKNIGKCFNKNDAELNLIFSKIQSKYNFLK